MKKYLLFLLVPLVLFSQPRRRSGEEFLPKFSPFSILLLPDSGSYYNLYFAYNIPFDKLVFQKGNSHFETSIRLTIEIQDSTKNLISREYDQKKVIADSFDDTKNKSLSVQGFIKTKIQAGNYLVEPKLKDLNSEGEFPFPPENLNIKDFYKLDVIKPFIINSEMINCGDYDYYSIANHGDHIPFSKEFYDIIIPVNDTSINYLDINFIESKDTVLSQRVYSFYRGNLSPEICSNAIILQREDTTRSLNYFLVKRVNKNLVEGNVSLEIRKEDKPDVIKFNIPVVWDNKPFSLRNPERAIESLKFIESDSTISALLDSNEDDYKDELFSYWKKFDPTPQTSFNELMAEYYERIDYADKEFRGIGRQSGINSDRSKVYVRYGKPDNIERNSNADGNVIEKWTYNNPERVFVFIDKRGTGNFTLVE